MAARSRVGHAALLVTALAALSTVLGLVLDAVVAAVYGAGHSWTRGSSPWGCPASCWVSLAPR